MRKIFLPILLVPIFCVWLTLPGYSQIGSGSAAGAMGSATRQIRVEFQLDKPVTWQGNKLSPGTYTGRFDAGPGGRPIILILRPKPGSDAKQVDAKEPKVKELRVATSMVDESHKSDQPQLLLDPKGRVCQIMLPMAGLRLMYCSIGKHDAGEIVSLSETYAPVQEP